MTQFYPLASGGFILACTALHQTGAVFQHFFGPPAVGFGVGLLSVHRRFPVATSIVSRRASRSDWGLVTSCHCHVIIIAGHTPTSITTRPTPQAPVDTKHLGDSFYPYFFIQLYLFL